MESEAGMKQRGLLVQIAQVKNRCMGLVLVLHNAIECNQEMFTLSI